MAEKRYEQRESKYERESKPFKPRVKRYNKNGIRIEGARQPKQRFFPGE